MLAVRVHQSRLNQYCVHPLIGRTILIFRWILALKRCIQLVFICIEGSETHTNEENSGIYVANNNKSNILFVEGTCIDGAVTLEKILSFATGTTLEPILGFAIQPNISSTVYEDRHRMYPTSNTCIIMLYLPYSL